MVSAAVIARQIGVALLPGSRVERVAKAEKYNYVFDKNEQVNILLYADTKDDLTNRVLDNLKRGK